MKLWQKVFIYSLVLVTLSVAALAALVSSFLPRIQPDSIQEVDTLSTLPAFTYAPPQRADVAQLVALRAYVDGLSAQGQKRAAIIASSFVFNTSIYEYTYRSMGILSQTPPIRKLSTSLPWTSGMLFPGMCLPPTTWW